MTPNTSGLIVVVKGQRRFVAAMLAARVVQRPPITSVPGAPLGIALVDGVVVPVLEVGDDPDEMLLCQVQGQLVALAGVRVHRAGFFPEHDDAIELDGESIPCLDVEAELQHLEQQIANRRPGEVP